MNFPFYSTVCQQEVTSDTVLTHPTTGEKYGGTDWLNDSKCAEIGAVPLTDDDGEIPENPVQTGTTIVVAEDCLSAKKIKQWRSKTEDELSAEFYAALDAARSSTIAERTRRLETLTVTLDETVYCADSLARTNIASMLTAMNSGISPPNPYPWRDANETNVLLSHEKLVELGALMLSATELLFQTSWQIRDEILPGLTTAELLAFNPSDFFESPVSTPTPTPEP
jgi:hypothetical protein